VALPDDDELIGDLCAPRWWLNSTGRLQIEGKDEIRKRLGRSPDAGDAVVMAFSIGGSLPSGDGGKVYYRTRLVAGQVITGPVFLPDPAWGSGPVFDGSEPEPFDSPNVLPRVRW
jgi:hypothetical protein